MFLQLLLVTIMAALLLGAVSVLVSTAIGTVGARRDFEKQGAGLKIADQFSFWMGHVNSVLFGEGQMYILDDALRRFNAKTVGWLYGHNKAAVSVDLDLIKRIIFDEQETDRIVMQFPVKELEVGCILAAKGEQWRRIRRAFAPALKPNKFKSPNVQREIQDSIDKLIRAIECNLERSNQDEIELNMDDLAHRYSLDLELSCFFKQNNAINFAAKVDPMTHTVQSGYESAMWLPIRLCVAFPILKPLVDWLGLHFHPQGVYRKKVMQFIKRQMKLNFEATKYLKELEGFGERIEDEDNFTLPNGTKFSRNMIDHVTDQFYEGKLTKTEYFHSTFFLIGAADKTASDAIVHALYQLATRADIQRKLRESIVTEGADSEYLSWVIFESLRLLPPVPLGCSRMTSRDYKCEDGVVPVGTFLTTATYSIHRLEQYWGPDADEFKPERFANAKDFHPLQFIPFGAGARSCPGKDFVLHEMKKLFCTLLMRYQFQCEPLDLRYNSPFFFYQLPNKQVHVRLSRV